MSEEGEFQIRDEKVAAIVVGFLHACSSAADEALEASRPLLANEEWENLRRRFGRILGGELYDLWAAVVTQHPHLNSAHRGAATERINK